MNSPNLKQREPVTVDEARRALGLIRNYALDGVRSNPDVRVEHVEAFVRWIEEVISRAAPLEGEARQGEPLDTLIYQADDRCWWREKAEGYTESFRMAGRFTRSEAVGRVQSLGGERTDIALTIVGKSGDRYPVRVAPSACSTCGHSSAEHDHEDPFGQFQCNVCICSAFHVGASETHETPAHPTRLSETEASIANAQFNALTSVGNPYALERTIESVLVDRLSRSKPAPLSEEDRKAIATVREGAKEDRQGNATIRRVCEIAEQRGQ